MKQWLHKFNLTAPLKHLEINPEFKSLESLVIQLPDNFHSIGQTIYKERNEIKLLETARGKMVIKSFGKIYLANRFIYAWIRASKAKRSFENAMRLRGKGIDTPCPVAYIECYKKGLIGTNMYAYLYADSTDNMRKVLGDENYPDREKLLQDFARFTFSLIQKEVYHKDYSPGNILFEKRGTEYHFALVDINRIRFGSISEQKKYKIFRRLMAGEKTLQFIAKTYAALYQDNEDMVAQKIVFYSNKFIRKKTQKKRLKKLFRKAFLFFFFPVL